MPRAKRANGEGSIYKLDDGRWRVVVKVGQRADGRMIRRSRIVASHADARAVVAQFQSETEFEGQTNAALVTVAEYLDRWLKDTVKPNAARNTYLSYKQQVSRQITPRLGKLKLRNLNAMHVQEFIAGMQRDGIPSPTRNYSYRVLHNAIERADKLGLIVGNPVARVDTPRAQRRQIVPFSQKEASAILNAVEGTSLEAAYVDARPTHATAFWRATRQILKNFKSVSAVYSPAQPSTNRHRRFRFSRATYHRDHSFPRDNLRPVTGTRGRNDESCSRTKRDVTSRPAVGMGVWL